MILVNLVTIWWCLLSHFMREYELIRLRDNFRDSEGLQVAKG